MFHLDTSFLIDYLDGRSYTAEFLVENADRPFYANTVSMYEVYVGEIAASSPDRGVPESDGRLDWLEVVPFEVADAREASRIYDELRDAGELINTHDILIGGSARRRGATVVTADEDYRTVADLDVEHLHRSER